MQTVGAGPAVCEEPKMAEASLPKMLMFTPLVCPARNVGRFSNENLIRSAFVEPRQDAITEQPAGDKRHDESKHRK